MRFKKKKILKFAALIGFSIIVLSIIASGLFKEAKRLPERDETMDKATQIIPMEVRVSLRDSIVDLCLNLLGIPYVVGSSGKNGFDCSGFVYYVFQHFKIKVPRSSSQFQHFGKEIPIDSVRKGDILVFLSPTRNVVGHLGIVTNPKGKESDFIHATSGRDMKVIITSLKHKGYNRRFVKAIDVL